MKRMVLCAPASGLNFPESDIQCVQGDNACPASSRSGDSVDFESHTCAFQTTWHNHIVRFHEYQPIAKIHTHLREHLIALDGWKLVDRANPALAFPTDFAVITVSSSLASTIVNSVLGLAFVKDVTLDRQLRSLQGREIEDSNPAQVGGGEVKKPDGRLRTRWSLEAPQSIEDDVNALRNSAAILQARKSAHESSVRTATSPHRADTNSNAHRVDDKVARHLLRWGTLADLDLNDSHALSLEAHKRQMLGGGTQVSAALGAPKLWSQGYKGKNIRVGVHLCLPQLCEVAA